MEGNTTHVTHTHTYIHTHKHTRTHARTQTHANTHVHTHARTHPHTYMIHIYIYNYVCVYYICINVSVVPAQLRAFVGDGAKAKDLGFMVAGGGCKYYL